MTEELLEKINNQLVSFEIQDGSEQRTIGDLIENKVRDISAEFAIENNLRFVNRRSKKSMEDFTIVEELDGVEVINYFDPKTHDINSKFSMPNLTSIDKLKKLLESSNQNLYYVFVSYEVVGNQVNILHNDIKNICELDFSILGIGSLGKGQLQILNMNKSLVFTNEGKTEWFGKLKTLVREYHTKRIKQIEKDKLKWI